tara:strand:- start:4143 stop:4472 length:330 start_codon:yes stop_codon:yes gene_type:complete
MNKIEQLEHAIEWFNKWADTTAPSTNNVTLEALELALEIAKGEAHVMRWVEPTELFFDADGIVLQDSINIGLWLHKSVNSLSVAPNAGCKHYATFNNSPVIPTPKDSDG